MAILGNDVLSSLKLPDFEPLIPIVEGVSQTIVANFWPQSTVMPQGVEHWVEVDENEHVLLTEYSKFKSKKAALLVHGLNGSFESPYIQRIGSRLLNEGYQVFCMTMRNAGVGLGRAKTTYHAGRSEDVEQCLKYISKKNSSLKEIALLGFSLGANVVLKTLGENRFQKLPLVGAAISPPIDLHACTKNRLQSPQGKFFDLLFSYLTYQEFKAMEPFLKTQIKNKKWRFGMSLKDIDDTFTAPLNNFESAIQYYESSSAARVYDQIQNPTLILTAFDDPVICPQFLLNAEKNPEVSLVVTDRGGHVAFLDRRKEFRRWMDELILRFILNPK